MKRVCLSNYAGDKLQAARARRENAFRAKQQQYEQVLDGVYAQRAEAGHEFIEAAKNAAVFSAAASLCDWVVAHAKTIPPLLSMPFRSQPHYRLTPTRCRGWW